MTLKDNSWHEIEDKGSLRTAPFILLTFNNQLAVLDESMAFKV